MDFKTFLENFDAIAQAPNGIPELRSLILDLAVRGKLVPQNPEEEPASKLLQKVQSNKQYLLEHNKLHQKKVPIKINKDEVPHYLPEGWIWCRLGHIIDCYRGHNPPKLEFVKEPREGYVRFIQITDFKTDEAAVYVPVGKSLKYVYKGEIAMAAYRHIGKLSRNVEGAFNVAICKVIEIEPISRDYLEKLIGSVYVKGELLAASGRAHIPSMHTEHLLSLVIPLPPLAEQKRIVEKVDELMALCDRLQSSQQSQDNLRQKLRASAIASLMNAETDEELKQSWAIVRDNWHTLSQKPEDVGDLRRSVLQLAVRGKLVAQDSEDQPASVLLEKTVVEKERLLKEKKIKKTGLLPAITEQEKPFELSEGWEWCRLSEIVFALGDGIHGTPQYTLASEYYFINGNNLRDGSIVIKPDTKTVSTEEFEKHRKPLTSNTVLVSINGTLGNVAFYNNEQIILGKSACYLNLSGCISKHYIKILLEGTYFREYAYRSATGTTIKNLSLKAMHLFPVPLPPFEEQKRIVAKVDELMQMCDHLEESLRQSQQRAEALAASAISHLET